MIQRLKSQAGQTLTEVGIFLLLIVIALAILIHFA